MNNTKSFTIPKGYKQTDIGVIPDDWDVKELQEIAHIKTGPFGSLLHERDYVSTGTPIITVEHLGDFGVTHDNLPLVADIDKKRLAQYSLKTNDIVFSRVGSVDRNSMIRKLENGWLFSGRLLRIRVFDENVEPKYLSYHFHQEPTKQRIRTVAVGQTMASLNTQILKGIKVAVTKVKEEQSAIAAALSDIDALIESLQKLIAKKRAIKQGAMQELLTGKRRLPGFQEKKGYGQSEIGIIPNDWELVSLDLVFDFLRTASYSREQLTENGNIQYVHYGDIHTKLNYFVNFSNTKLSSIRETQAKIYSLIQDGDIIMADASEDYEGIGKSVEVRNLGDNKAISGLHTFLLRDKADYFVDGFRGFIFSNSLVKASIDKYATGLKVYGISKNNLKLVKIPKPPKPEQAAIAATLFGMDSEIDSLEQKLDKYKQLKQGMMQVLLTGKIRLPIT